MRGSSANIGCPRLSVMNPRSLSCGYRQAQKSRQKYLRLVISLGCESDGHKKGIVLYSAFPDLYRILPFDCGEAVERYS